MVVSGQLLRDQGIAVHLVSMPSREVFLAQTTTYQEMILPSDIPVIVVEAGVAGGWYGIADEVIGLDSFGESAPADALFAEYGLTPAHIAEYIAVWLDEGDDDSD